jgi:hypothetical protein
MILDAMSDWMVVHGWGVVGAEVGSRGARYPGWMVGRTGRFGSEAL